MKDARTLLFDLLAVTHDGKQCAVLFAEDGVLELPFLHSLGIPSRHQGREAIANFYDYVGQTLYPGFGFAPEDVSVLIDTDDQVFAEYRTIATAASTGRQIHHLFAGRLVAERGEIKLLRESLNTVAAAQVLNPNGVADLAPHGDKIFSVPLDYAA